MPINSSLESVASAAVAESAASASAAVTAVTAVTAASTALTPVASYHPFLRMLSSPRKLLLAESLASLAALRKQKLERVLTKEIML